MAKPVTFTKLEMTSMNGRVEALRKQSRWSDMAELQVKMLHSLEQTLGKEHPDTLALMHNLAITYSNGKQLKNAAELFRPLYETRRKLLGPEHQTTLVTMHYLAATCTDLGRLTEAESLHRELLSIRKRLLGGEHVDTLRTMQYLAVTFGNQGKLTDARNLYEEMLPIRRRKLGNDHAATALVANNLAVTYTDLGQFDKAEVLHLEVLAFRRGCNGIESRDALRTAYYLVTTYVGLRKYQQAEGLLLEVLPLFDRVFGKSHKFSMTGMNHLASIYEKNGSWNEAERYEKELLDRQKQIRGEAHPDTLSTMKSLSIVYQYQRRWREVDLIEESIERLTASSGSKPQTTWYSAAIGPIASTNQSQPMPQSPDSLQSVDTDTLTRILGSDHPESIASLEADALSLIEQERWAGAETILTEVLARRRRVQGSGHPFTIQTMSNLASVYQSQEKTGNAVELFHTALTYLEQNHSAVDESLRSDIHRRLSALQSTTKVSLEPPRVPGTPEHNGKRPLIAATVTPNEIMAYLTSVNCPDLTQILDESKCGYPVQHGGFGAVSQGALNDGRMIALKYIREDKGKRLKYLARELYSWSKAQHRNVLELLGLAHFRGNIVMVSPWMKFGNLRDYLQKHPLTDRISVMVQVVEGVNYLHNIPMIHGDIKAANIFVSKQGTPKIGDFGTSTFQGDPSIGFSTTVNQAVGTMRWMAPEMFKENSACSREADVYALGMTMLEILTGKVPFWEYDHDYQIIGAVVRGTKPACPQGIAPESKLWRLLSKCWEQAPRERPTAEKVLHEVLELATEQDANSWTLV